MENQIQNSILEYTDDVIWNNIIQKSNNLETPSVFQLSETTSSYHTLKNSVLSVINNFMNTPKDLGIMKIYIDGGIISDPFRFLSDNPKNADESIEAWKNRIQPDKTLVLKLDTCIALSDELHYVLQEFLHPVLVSEGIPLGGIGVSLEFGDHKWSPDGLEEDLTQKKKFTINIGETNQTIYEWTPQKQQEVGGLIKKKGKVQNFTDYLMNHSEKYKVSQDQIAVMSNRGMYIIEHEGFYYKIRIHMSDLTKTELLQQMLFGIAAAAMSGKIRGRGANILPVYNIDQHDDFTQEILKDLQYSANDLNLTMRDLLKKSFNDMCYARRSNCGFLGFIRAREHSEVSDKFRDISKDAKIKLKNAKFKIEYYSQGEETFLFMRGQKTVVKQSKFVMEMIDLLNKGESLMWHELKSTKYWKASAIEKLIQIAYKFRTISIIES